MCRDGACVSARCGHGSPCRVFVSAEIGPGDFGGLDGADTLCQTEADGVPALEGGIYRAWLSTGSESPTTRFSHLPDSGPFVMTNGSAIANSWADLISGSNLLSVFNRRSDGTTTVAVPVTNTTPFGTSAVGPDCSGWTSRASNARGLVGATWATNAEWTWTNDVSRPCSNTNLRLFCFEQR